ncbi:Coatomer subunit beta [Grifola frondosa]|uniref:Coatomer subunit beta n=1 Tax=Grifola frondosa TaxID=5627 RepID=A0A1C7LUP8_GRIFR|nr:Coatomer subunit beta [Grifola frondosa]
MSADACCYTLIFEDSSETPTTQELRTALQKGTDEVKLDTLRKIIVSTINGNPQPQLLMPIIQYVMPSRNKALKKLLHFYWEVCPKYDENGKLKQEMILVVNAIRNDLQHPNEYIRGATLRFLQKISKDTELLEPLIPTCRACLEHRHSYVRKNAVFAVYAIYREFEHLIPDAPELIQTFLAAESDATCKRNAFVFLAQCAMQKAVEYIFQVFDQIPSMDELLQMSIIEVIRLDCKQETTYKARYILLISELLNVSSHAVKYEAATTLTSLTQNPAAVKAAASCYINLVMKESDNNAKLIVLDRLDSLRSRHGHVLDSLIMDVLQILSSTDLEVRRKALSIVLSLTSSRNVEDVLQKTQDQEFEKAPEYRQLLIQSIHVCAVKFSEVAASVVHALMDFLGDSNNPSALDVVAFVREVVEKFPLLRATICEKLIQTLGEIKSGKVYRGVLWILGEYAENIQDIQATFRELRKVLGEIPILASEQRLLEDTGAEDGEEKKDEQPKTDGAKPRVLADGTYATETAFTSLSSAKLEAVKAAAKPPLRTLILGGDFFTGSVLAAALTKLVLRYSELSSEQRKINALRAEAMLIMASVIRVGQSKFVTAPIDEDSSERIMNCIQTLSELEDKSAVHEMFLEDTKAAYSKMVAAQEKKAAEKKESEQDKATIVQVDDVLTFRQFSKKGGDDIIDDSEDVDRATGAGDAHEDFISNLSRISQLTGFSDPIYAEAYVKVHGFDIQLDVLLVNQTPNTLQNLCLDFATLGDLKLVERPSVYTIAPHSFQSIKATIKVSSTETGVIFGSILWEGPGMSEQCVILNDIHIDIMDYIKPAYCTEAQFRSMWTEFEWENRVNVTTSISNPREYLEHVMSATNMSCLTPEGAISGECDFLSANMYARSLFGEDALANLSVERTEGGTINGHVRIRSKTQGIALSLGDRITMDSVSCCIPCLNDNLDDIWSVSERERDRDKPSSSTRCPAASMSASYSSEDKEKGLVQDEVHRNNAAEVSPDDALVRRFGRFGPFLSKVFASGVEARGVERVPEDQRENKNMWNKSVNTVLTTIPIGTLGQQFFTLSFSHTVATIICFGALGGVATAFISTLGPQTGLRTMIITRFSSGYVGGTIYSILNILTQLGFSVTAVILGGQTLASINPGTLPLVVGIIIVGVCSVIPCFVGYHWVHVYERYAWIITFIVMLFLWGLGGSAGFDINAQKASEDTGRALSADILSFGSIVFGSFSGWAPVAADYNCRLPVDTPSSKVFILTFFGLFIPICFVEILGAALMTITDPAYVEAFADGSTGGLIGQVLSPWKGGGKFILVLLALSVVANNIPNSYSAGLSMQSLGRPFAMVPRFFWTLLAFVIYTVAGVAGREHFSEILSNFLSILSYWTAFFIVIVAEEHYIFRRKGGVLGGYNLNDWDSPSRLPLGFAGVLAGCFGVAGAVVGMSEVRISCLMTSLKHSKHNAIPQVWYTGPLGLKAGAEFGADLGFELAAGFAAVVYPPLRWLEIHYTGR